MISRVFLPPLITCGTYNVIFSLFITGPFSDHTDSLSSAPGGYSGNSVQSGNHLSTLRKILPKKAETFNFIFDEWREKCFIDVTSLKVKSGSHPSSWNRSNTPIQIIYARWSTTILGFFQKGNFITLPWQYDCWVFLREIGPKYLFLYISFQEKQDEEDKKEVAEGQGNSRKEKKIVVEEQLGIIKSLNPWFTTISWQ